MPVFRVASSSPYAPSSASPVPFERETWSSWPGPLPLTARVRSSAATTRTRRRKRPCARSAQSSPRQAPTCRTLSRHGCTLMRMTTSPHQSLITVEGVRLEGAAEALEARLKVLAHARIIALVSETNRMTSLRGRTTILAVVDHD